MKGGFSSNRARFRNGEVAINMVKNCILVGRIKWKGKKGKGHGKKRKAWAIWQKMAMVFFFLNQNILFDVYTKMQKAPHEYSGFSKTEKENYVINPNVEFHLM